MLKDEVEKYFTESGIPDIFLNAISDYDSPEDLEDYEFESSIKAIRNTFIKTLWTYLLLTSEAGKIDVDLKHRFLGLCHEELLRKIAAYYEKLAEIIEYYVDCEKYASTTEFFADKIKQRLLKQECATYISLLYDNDLLKVFGRFETGDIILRAFDSEPSSFIYENLEGERAYIPNSNLLNENDLIDSQKYFFYEIFTMIIVFQIIAPIFKSKSLQPASIYDDFIYFDKIDDLYSYSRTFISLDVR